MSGPLQGVAGGAGDPIRIIAGKEVCDVDFMNDAVTAEAAMATLVNTSLPPRRATNECECSGRTKYNSPGLRSPATPPANCVPLPDSTKKHSKKS